MLNLVVAIQNVLEEIKAEDAHRPPIKPPTVES
jgi:hypothetical protein